MKKRSIYAVALFGLLGLTVAGCGDKTDEYPWQVVDKSEGTGSGEDGGNSGAPTIETLEATLMSGLREIQSFDNHKYQYQRTNSIDVFAGYTTVSQNQFTFGGALPSTYSTQALQNYYNGIMDKTVFNNIHDAYFYAEELGKPEWKALAMIAYDLLMSQFADFYGPMPFDDYRNLKENPPITYVSVEEIYDRCFTELKEAAEILNERKPSAEELAKVEGRTAGELASDITNGNYLMWVKLANSLRLRLAMNIIKVDPVRAQQEAEAAINAEGGVFDCGPNGEVTDPDFDYQWYNYQSGAQHPLYFICWQWYDSRLSASFENICKRLRSPMLGILFAKNYAAITNNSGNPSGYSANQDWVGIRQGSAMINKSNLQSGYGPFSMFNQVNYPRTLMHVSEVLFARAEARLRGWNVGGTAEEWYNKGIRRAMLGHAQYGITEADITTYMNQTDFEWVDYVDPYNEINNIDGRVEIGVKWNDDDSDELKLEKIITQRWIAIFPQSPEAWTTFRRTGYPRLFPVDPGMNNWDDDINCEVQIRRIPYYDKSASAQADLTNAANILAGESSEVGSTNNSPMTRIWWDINTDEIDMTTEEGRVIPHNFN